MFILRSIKKEGLKIYVTNVEDKTYLIDMEKREIVSYTGRKLSRNPFTTFHIECDSDIDIKYARYIAKGTFSRDSCELLSYWEKLDKYEKFLPYLDLIREYDSLPSEIPEGYIPFLRENNLNINKESFEEFAYERKINTFSNADRKRLKNLNFIWCGAKQWVEKHIDDKKLITDFLKVCVNSLKIFESTCYASNLAHLIDEYGAELLSNEATVEENVKVYNALKYKERNEKIIANQMKIKELETTFEHSDYCVVVPTTMEAFTDEGNQQHNCVGSYYHDSIADGRNLIYFLRRKDDKNTSFETCRFSIPHRYTVEQRAKHNNCASRETTKLTANVIDNLIKEMLGE